MIRSKTEEASGPTATRRHAMAGAGAAALASTLSGPAQARTENAQRPNILWLVSEDNNPLIGAYGDRLAQTPNLDAMARDGVLFRHAFSNAPVCAPSRFGILTGCYPQTCAPAQHMRANADVPEAFVTYPEYLRAAGYYCTNNDKTDYNCDIDPARIWNASNGHAHWRDRPADAPFMAVFNTMTTHESKLFVVTEGKVSAEDVRLPVYLPDTPGIRQDLASYYNLMERMDAEIGERLKELEDDGLSDDTIVFYYSDNGGCRPRSKHFAYDEGFRCSLIVRAPEKWKHLLPAQPGEVVEDPVCFVDFAPTLLSLIGAAAPVHMHGKAFMGPAKVEARTYSFGTRDRMDERYDFIRTVGDGRYHYIRNYMPHRPVGVNLGFPWLMKSFRDWEAAWLAGSLTPQQARFFEEKPFEEFYDLRADPDQVVNLIAAPDQVGRIADFRKTLDAQMLAVRDAGFIPEGSELESYAISQDEDRYPLGELMVLGEMAARRDRKNLNALREATASPNLAVRYWAVSGLLALGEHAQPAINDIARILASDDSLNVRIIAAETLARSGQPEPAVSFLADVLDRPLPFALKLQALNALTFIGEPAKTALPQISAMALDEQANLRTAGRYLKAVLDGVYTPDFPSFDYPWFRARMAATATSG